MVSRVLSRVWEDVESRYGLRWVRVGAASHPGPPDGTFRDRSKVEM